MEHRVIIDTNVILTGALLSQSIAGQLWKRNEKFVFIVTDFIISEASKVVRRNAKSQEKAIAAEVLIANYLKRLKTITISELYLKGNIDDEIYRSAVKNNCEYICTYNIKHFSQEKVKAISPLTIMKEIDVSELVDFLPFFWFGEEGTVLLNMILTHYSSLGEIFSSDNGVEVFVDNEGLLQVTGKSVEKCSIRNALPQVSNQRLFLIIRYKKNFFEAKTWDSKESRWIVLSEGKVEFKLPIFPKLGTTGKLNGIIYDFSAIPRFVKSKDLVVIVQNGCLEGAIGSVSISELLNRIKIEKITNDEWRVNF